eukprot:366577-Chlamydomonas_euryale.AAC.26
MHVLSRVVVHVCVHVMHAPIHAYICPRQTLTVKCGAGCTVLHGCRPCVLLKIICTGRQPLTALLDASIVVHALLAGTNAASRDGRPFSGSAVARAIASLDAHIFIHTHPRERQGGTVATYRLSEVSGSPEGSIVRRLSIRLSACEQFSL